MARPDPAANAFVAHSESAFPPVSDAPNPDSTLATARPRVFPPKPAASATRSFELDEYDLLEDTAPLPAYRPERLI